VNVLNLQVNRLYHFELHSKDTLHSFSVPAFRLKQDAVPGRSIVGWFRPTVTGEFDIQCAELCGIGHGLMGARVRIRSAAAQAAWMETAPRMPLVLSERSESNGQLAAVTPAVTARRGER
jgi:cytochrome c oxidase subunit 2